MSSEMSEDREKIAKYLSIIQERILAPIHNTEVQRYCTATLLLLFAAIDGLGKLLVPDDTAGVNERIRGFLQYMGGAYEDCEKGLLKLRHSLVHNAINVESFLSEAEIPGDWHLKKIGVGLICVNTMALYKDFVASFERFRCDIQNNPAMRRRAADRLEWVETADPLEQGEIDPLDPMDNAAATPPTPIGFIRVKRSRKCHCVK